MYVQRGDKMESVKICDLMLTIPLCVQLCHKKLWDALMLARAWQC